MPENARQELLDAMNEAKAAYHAARDTAQALAKAYNAKNYDTKYRTEEDIKEQIATLHAEAACVETHTAYLKAETAYFNAKPAWPLLYCPHIAPLEPCGEKNMTEIKQEKTPEELYQALQKAKQAYLAARMLAQDRLRAYLAPEHLANPASLAAIEARIAMENANTACSMTFGAFYTAEEAFRQAEQPSTPQNQPCIDQNQPCIDQNNA